MKTTIVLGLGAVGSVLASELAASGRDVLCVARGYRARQLRSEGLRISGACASARDVEVAEPGDPLPDAERIIVAVKQPQFEEAVAGLASVLRPTTTLAVAMNGLPWWIGRKTGADGALRALLDRSGTLGRGLERRSLQALVLYFGATSLPDGSVGWSGRGTVVHGGIRGNPAPLSDLPHLRVEAAKDIRHAIFDKLVGNLAYGPLALLTGKPNAAIAADPVLVRRQYALAAELKGLARALNIDAPLDPAAVFADGASFGDTFKASMLVDFERGAPPEIDALLAAPCVAARALGFALPELEIMWKACVDRVEQEHG